MPPTARWPWARRGRVPAVALALLLACLVRREAGIRRGACFAPSPLQQRGAQRCERLRRAAFTEEEIAATVAQAEALRLEAEQARSQPVGVEDAVALLPEDFEEEATPMSKEARALFDQAAALRAEAEGEMEVLEQQRSERASSDCGSEGDCYTGGCPPSGPVAADSDCGSCSSSSSCGSSSNSEARAERALAKAALAVLAEPDMSSGWLATTPPGKMNEFEWRKLANEFDGLTGSDKHMVNDNLGPQGRRMLRAMLRGEAPGGAVYVVPGCRVRIVDDDDNFPGYFSMFIDDPVNGYTEEKEQRIGQECIVWKTYGDRTFTALFADGAQVDFPMEVVEGFDEKGIEFSVGF